MSTLRSKATILALSLAALAGCDGDSTGVDPQLALVAGDYTAEGAYGAFSFTTNDGPETIDWLSRGASVVISLSTDGSTAGRLFVPGADEDGGDLDEDLAGSWTLDEDVVRFQHDADTFLRDMPFTFEDGRLSGEETFAVTIRLVLARR